MKDSPAPPAPGPAAHCSRASACHGESRPPGSPPWRPLHVGLAQQANCRGFRTHGTPQTTDGLPGVPRRASPNLSRPHSVPKAPVRGQAPLLAPAAKSTPQETLTTITGVGPLKPQDSGGLPAWGRPTSPSPVTHATPARRRGLSGVTTQEAGSPEPFTEARQRGLGQHGGQRAARAEAGPPSIPGQSLPSAHSEPQPTPETTPGDQQASGRAGPEQAPRPQHPGLGLGDSTRGLLLGAGTGHSQDGPPGHRKVRC